MPSPKPFVRFVTRKWPPAVGGMETYSVRLAELLPKYCDLDVVALAGQSNGDPPAPMRLLAFGVRTFFGLLFARKPADITHVADLASWPLGLAAKMRRPGSKIVLSAHGTDVSYAFRHRPANRAYRAYLTMCRLSLSQATLVANSSATAEALGELGFKKVEIVPLAADVATVTPPETPDRHILFAGRIVRRKGLSWFVNNVLDHLPKQISLHVAGPLWDQAEAECLQHDRVVHLGVLSQEELLNAYGTASCVVVPNLDLGMQHLEGFGLVAPEASNSGAVVLAARTGGLSNAILDAKTGFLLSPGNSEEWIAKIREVLDWDLAERRAFIENAQRVGVEYFSWERVARETFGLYVTQPQER